MGNRAVITTKTGNRMLSTDRSDNIGVYLHWSGGRDSVEAFLLYCKLQEYRTPENDDYGWARLCQIIGNFFGGSTSIGINQCRLLDCDNGNNGVYIIENWEIVGREYFHGEEQHEYSLLRMLLAIDRKQPEHIRLGEEKIVKALEERSKQ